MDTTTAKLDKLLKDAKEIDAFLEENKTLLTDPNLQTHLNHLLAKKKLARKDVVKDAGLDSSYGNQLFSGIKKNPGRDHVLSLAFGFGLNQEETERLLKVAGVGALYPKNKRDAVIIHALENKKSAIEVNEALHYHGLRTLSEE